MGQRVRVIVGQLVQIGPDHPTWPLEVGKVIYVWRDRSYVEVALFGLRSPVVVSAEDVRELVIGDKDE